MPLDLPHDVRHRKRCELSTIVEVEAVDRVDEPDAAGLEEVVVVLGALVAVREALDEGEVQLNQAIPRSDIASLEIGMKQIGCRRCLLALVRLPAYVFHRPMRRHAR